MDESSELNIAELRVTGPDNVLDELKENLGLHIDAEWKKGEEKRFGGNHQVSGFNANIADETSTERLMEALSTFIVSCERSSLTFKTEGVSASIDIGVSIGADEAFGPRVKFSQSTINTLGALGLGLEISTYPADNEGESSDST